MKSHCIKTREKPTFLGSWAMAWCLAIYTLWLMDGMPTILFLHVFISFYSKHRFKDFKDHTLVIWHFCKAELKMGPSKPKPRNWWNYTPFNPLSEGVCFPHSSRPLSFESSPCGVFRFPTLSPSFLSCSSHDSAEVGAHTSEHFHCLKDIRLNSTEQKAQPAALVIWRHIFTLLRV